MIQEQTTPLSSFPKNRPELPPSYAQIYEKHYKINRNGTTVATGLAQKMESWMHRQVAKDLATHQGPAPKVLEIGGGTLNHLPYEKNVAIYDVVEPLPSLYEDSVNKNRVHKFYSDMSEIPQDQKYDRIVSIATFEHICNLPEVIASASNHLNPEGSLRVAIPAEGSLLWFLGWRFTTGIDFYLKYRLNYSVLMRYEHINNWKEIAALLNFFFKDVKYTYLGLSKNFSFYHFYECKLPKKDMF